MVWNRFFKALDGTQELKKKKWKCYEEQCLQRLLVRHLLVRATMPLLLASLLPLHYLMRNHADHPCKLVLQPDHALTQSASMPRPRSPMPCVLSLRVRASALALSARQTAPRALELHTSYFNFEMTSVWAPKIRAPASARFLLIFKGTDGVLTKLGSGRMVGEWMMDPIKIPWFRHPGGGSRPNLTEESLSAAMGCFVQGHLVDRGFNAIGEHTGAGHNRNIVTPFGGESLGSEGPGMVIDVIASLRFSLIGQTIEGESANERSRAPAKEAEKEERANGRRLRESKLPIGTSDPTGRGSLESKREEMPTGDGSLFGYREEDREYEIDQMQDSSGVGR
ncbi:hypothetical protein M5K25_004938 [Dendrobium thyrsiflorum]|uniref:Uncharacterized protein n=1 Tax=Dendrobium thyrsiflorum TaxID=117978 RepID=A0ABD0VGL6_DENTH